MSPNLAMLPEPQAKLLELVAEEACDGNQSEKEGCRYRLREVGICSRWCPSHRYQK